MTERVSAGPGPTRHWPGPGRAVGRGKIRQVGGHGRRARARARAANSESNSNGAAARLGESDMMRGRDGQREPRDDSVILAGLSATARRP